MAQENTDASRKLPSMAKWRGRHFVTDQEYTCEELNELLQLAIALKKVWKKKCYTPFLEGRTLAMIFDQPSTRTRVSFEAAMTELGGHGQYLRPGEIHLGARESVKDTAIVLSRLCHAIEARLLRNADLRELARWATVPVVNGYTDDYDHPIQTMTDAMTMLEHAGSLEGLTVAFVGKGAEGTAQSIAMTCSRLGVNTVFASPRDKQLDPSVQALARANCEKSGATFTMTEDAVEAVSKADFVYTLLWWWMESEEEKAEIRRKFAPYQVNAELWSHTKPGCKFMHPLPAIRGEEVTDEMIDSASSVCWDQAENRKHLEKAVLLALIGIDELPSDPDLQEIGRALLS